MDLSKLGIPVDKDEVLYKRLESPFNPNSFQQSINEYHIAEDHEDTQQSSDPFHPSRYSVNTLGYIFYSSFNGKRKIANDELLRRGWRFCESEQVWIMRVPNSPVLRRTNNGELGLYYVLANNRTAISKHEIFIEYDKFQPGEQRF
ncbi:hypothetical protein ACOME3_006867 [Neoechinorhynchus agilis]